MKSVDRLRNLEEQNAYLLDSHKKIEAFMTLTMELGKGFKGFGLTKEVFQKQLDPEGNLEQWTREKVTNFREDMDE